jgi:TPR repeat protein
MFPSEHGFPALTIFLEMAANSPPQTQVMRGKDVGAISQKAAEFLIRSRLADAEAGDVDALMDLGISYSTGRGGVTVDLVEAHKWFNLAALSGCTRGQECRAEIALEMTAREIAEAQRQARAWLAISGDQRRAA